MSRIADFFPMPVESREDRTAAERAREAAKPGAGRAVLDAINSEWSTSWAFRQLSGAGYPADPDFIIDDANFNEFTKDVPPHLWSMFDEAKSLDHANKIRSDALSIAGSRDRLASIGWKGTGLRIGAAIFDPIDLTIGAAAGAVSGGIGAAAGVATKATRLQRMLRAGFIGSASAIPVQAYISSQDPEQDELDVLYAGIGGFLGGSISGIWGKTRLKDAAAEAARDIEALDTVRFAMGAAGADEFNIRVRDMVQNNVLTDEGKAYLREQFNPERQSRLLESRIARSGLDPVEDAEILAEIRKMDPIEAFSDSRLGPVAEVEFPAELPARRTTAPDVVEARATKILDESHPAAASPVQIRAAGNYAATSVGEIDRPMVLVEVDGAPVVFYRSSQGTGGKQAGSWYPMFGIGDDDWIIKGSVENMESGYGRAGLRAVSASLTKQFEGMSADEVVAALTKSHGNLRGGRQLSQEAYGSNVFKGMNPADESLVADHVRGILSRFKETGGITPAEARKLALKQLASEDAASTAAAASRNPNLRPPTEDEINARASQIREDFPNMSPESARETAIFQIGQEDATRRGIKPDMTPKDKGPAGPVGPPPPRQFKPGDLNLDGHSDAPAAATGLRRSYASILGAENLPPDARAVASMLAEDALLRTDGTAGRASATTWVRRSTLGTLAGYYRAIDDAARAFFRREGTTLFKRGAARTEFAEKAGNAMRLNPSRIQDKLVLAAVKASRRAINQAFEIAKRAGVRGLDELEAADDYFPRIYSLPKINTLTTTHGNDTLERLFTAAIKGGTPTIDDAMAEKLGKGVLKIIRGTGEWTDMDKARLLSGGNRDGWVKILRDEFPGIDDAKIDSILGPKLADDAGNIDRAKHRLLLKEQATVTTEDGRNLAFGEMLNNDIDQVTELYVRQMMGAAAESELLRAANNKFGTDFTSWDGLKAHLGDAFNKLKFDKKITDEKMRLLDNLRKHVRGIPVYPDTTFARVLRRIQGVNYALRSGGFGIAQIPELANIVEEAGVRAMMSQFVPALGAMVDQARKGRFTNEMFAELEATLGSGAEWLTRRFHDRHAGEILTGADLAITKFDRGLDQFNRTASIVSGMRHVDQFSKLWAAASLSQRFVNIASAGRTPSLKRLNSMGIRDAEQWERLSAAIRAEQKAGTIRFEKGVLTGRRVANLNIDDWADQDSAALFIDILDKTSTRAIQVNDIGNLHPVFDNPLGRAVFQFRSFHIASWDKALARGAQMRDIDTFTKVSFGTMLAAMVYSAQQYANSIGRPDAEEFREKNLSRRAVASAAIQRSGWASMLPQFAEEAWKWSGGQGSYGPLFDARNTGLRSGVFSVDGTPMLALPRELGRAAAGVGGMAFGDDFTQKDARAASQLLPFRNVMGFKNVLESLIQQFPEDE